MAAGCSLEAQGMTYHGGWRSTSAVWLWASLLVALSFSLQGRIQINLADEGYLWYGTWRTAHGEIPLRDFIAYFPGRYYWGAGWSILFGPGIMGLRASLALFQVLGLVFGLLALRRVIRSWRWLVPAGGLLLLWMYPRHKIFEHGISLAAVYFALLLVEKPTIRRHFIAGAFVGLSAFFGLNHALYVAVSFFLLTLLLWLNSDRSGFFRRFAVLGAGFLLGATPILFMLFFVPDFFSRVIDFIMLLMRAGSTNLPLPVPWPWEQAPLPADFLKAASSISFSLFFIMLPAFYLLGGAYLLLSRPGLVHSNPLACACILVGVTWMHHAFARPDLPHLAQAIQPFLVGVMSLPLTLKRGWLRILAWGGIACVTVMSLFSVGVQSPFYDKTIAHPNAYAAIDINGEHLWVRHHNARLIKGVMDANAELIPTQEGLLIACHLPGLYPMLNRTSPLWDFFLLPVKMEDRQRRQISVLEEKQVGWLLLNDMTIDGRDELRLKNSHPLLWQYFMDNFTPIAARSLPPSYWFMKRID